MSPWKCHLFEHVTFEMSLWSQVGITMFVHTRIDVVALVPSRLPEMPLPGNCNLLNVTFEMSPLKCHLLENVTLEMSPL